MKIGVLLKQVPPTGEQIKIASASTGIDTTDLKWEINPYDEFALEEALRLRDAKTASDVVIITLGGADTEPRIRDGLARGADRAIRLDDPAFAGSDSLGQARIIAAAVAAEGVQLLLTGKIAVDVDHGDVAIMVAELLGWAHVGVVDKLEVSADGLKAWRAASGGGRDVVECGLPALITCDKGLNEPRYASLKGIMMAKKKTVAVKGAGELGLDASTVGAGAAVATEGNWSAPPQRPPGRILDGDNETRVKELVRLLRDEAKVL